MNTVPLHQPQRGADESFADYQLRRERSRRLAAMRHLQARPPEHFDVPARAQRARSLHMLAPFRLSRMTYACRAAMFPTTPRG